LATATKTSGSRKNSTSHTVAGAAMPSARAVSPGSEPRRAIRRTPLLTPSASGGSLPPDAREGMVREGLFIPLDGSCQAPQSSRPGRRSRGGWEVRFSGVVLPSRQTGKKEREILQDNPKV